MNGRAYGDHGVFDDGEPEGGLPLPPCPICPRDLPHRVVVNTGNAGGLLCEGCMFVFDGDRAEAMHPRTQRRRDLWVEGNRAKEKPPVHADGQALRHGASTTEEGE